MSAQPNPPLLTTALVGNVTVVRFCAHLILTGEKSDAVGAELYRLADTANPCRLLLDFANVQSLTSSILGKLILTDKKVVARGGRLALCNLNPDLREVFEITQLHRLLNVYPGEPEALASF